MANPSMRRSKDASELDCYETESIAVRAAVNSGVFAGVGSVYDPCNGLGGITKILQQYGIETIGSDIVDYGIGDMAFDFLGIGSGAYLGVDAIVFNPPFKLTSEFLDKAFQLHHKVIMFNRWSFLETLPRAKKITSRQWPLTDVYLFSYRVGCAEFKDGEYEDIQRATQYAWYVFDKRIPVREPRLHWITHKPKVSD